MKYYTKFFLIVNPILIILSITMTPFFMDIAMPCNFEGKFQDVCLEQKEKWSIVMYVVPVLGANLMLGLVIVITRPIPDGIQSFGSAEP